MPDRCRCVLLSGHMRSSPQSDSSWEAGFNDRVAAGLHDLARLRTIWSPHTSAEVAAGGGYKCLLVFLRLWSLALLPQ